MLLNRLKNFRVKISYLTQEMTIDRNTIVTLHKKGHSNSFIARSYIFAVNALQGGKKVQLDTKNMVDSGMHSFGIHALHYLISVFLSWPLRNGIISVSLLTLTEILKCMNDQAHHVNTMCMP